MTSPMMPQQAKSFLFQAFLRRNFESACTRPTGHDVVSVPALPPLSRGRVFSLLLSPACGRIFSQPRAAMFIFSFQIPQTEKKRSPSAGAPRKLFILVRRCG
ncbi:hypothetical protein TNCV_2893641 [Trichonephila clavipes]|nr:hypothetical protein TNCV_2893641 [Trichonephila clavipes]